MKTFFGITLGLFLFVLIFWGVYNFGFKHNPNIPTVSESGTVVQESTSLSTPTLSKKVSPVLTERVLSAATSEKSLLFYSLDEQAFRKATLEGKDKQTLLSHLPGTPLRIVWSPARDRALVNLEFPDGRSLWHVADLTLKTLIALKPEISRINWDNTGSKIFYQYTDPETKERTLNISSPDGKDWQKVVSLGARDFFLAPIPQSILLSYWPRPSARDSSFLNTVTLAGGTPTTLLSGHFGADFLWAPTGDKVLMSSTDAAHPGTTRLSLLNETGGELHTIENAATMINKAIWSKNGHVLYYALPGSLPDGTVLPNDYFEKNLHSQDSFWKLDVNTGKAERLVDLKDLSEALDATNLFMSPNEDTLYFIERKSQKLYQIAL